MRALRTLFVIGLFTVATAAQDIPAVSFEQLTIGATAVPLAANTIRPAGLPAAARCVGVLEDAAVRIRTDGTAPTASTGRYVPLGATVEIRGAAALRQFSAIRVGATSGVLALDCYPSTPSDAGLSGVTIIPAAAGGVSTTGTGAEVHATSPTITSPTIAAGALSGIFTGSPTFSGEPLFTGRLLIRENFDAPLVVVEEDFTAKVLTDAGINVVLGSPIGIIEYREELAKTASSWVQTAGAIDISADNTTNDEGVEIYIGDDDNTTTGWLLTGTTGLCFEVNFTVTLIAGTDQFVIGWRQNEAFVDGAVYSGYTDWAVVGINNVDGSIFANHEINGGAGALSDDSGTNAANGGTYTLKSCISAAGVHTAFVDGVAITMTNGSDAQTAGIYMNPFISYLQAGGVVDAAILINWMQISPL